MNFTNYADYEARRQTLLAEVDALLEAGNTTDAEARMQDIRDLDNAYDAFSTAQANRNALSNARPAAVRVGDGTSFGAQQEPVADAYNTNEYRNAFMAYVVNGTPIPGALLNANETTTTTDAGAVIPTTIMERIVERMEVVGNILKHVTRTNYKGGLAVPVATVKPVATWPGEGKGSDRQKLSVTKDAMITFAGYKLRCAVSITVETATMALPVFERTFVRQVADAMIKALEEAIIKGTGVGQPKGITTYTAPEGQAIELAEGDALTYSLLCDAEAALPQAYEANAIWVMSKKTFMAFEGMTDQNGQPIARVNYGLNGKPERFLLGRPVECTEYMASYGAAVEADSMIAFIYDMSAYIVNTNLDMTIKQYEDNETDDQVTKAIMLVDGKIVDINSLVTVTVKNG